MRRILTVRRNVRRTLLSVEARRGWVRRVRNGRYGPRAMRLMVARCEVDYTGRLNATLPEAVRLLVFKTDGSVLVHDDSGGYKPLNWIR
jgi:RecB family endonuclease NucS